MRFPNLRLAAAAACTILFISGCSDEAIMNDPSGAPSAVLTDGGAGADALLMSSAQTTQVFESGSDVTTWDPIYTATADHNWKSTVCTAVPGVGLNANWQNPHNASVVAGHPWAGFYFSAPWINAWNDLSSTTGPGYPGSSSANRDGHNWTKYETTVSGNGSFVIRLLADNCSWIYLDAVLVGVQPEAHNPSNTSYGLTMNGTHTLSFIIFDGGGAAGGKYILETTTNPPPSLNPDLDGDDVDNDDDAFPLDPNEWDDTDGDGVGDNADAFPNDPNESADSDGDGVGDNADPFPNSDTSATIVVGDKDTGVANQSLGDGSTFNDRLGECTTDARNHGQFVSCVVKLTDEWKKAGLISGREAGQIRQAAAGSNGKRR